MFSAWLAQTSAASSAAQNLCAPGRRDSRGKLDSVSGAQTEIPGEGHGGRRFGGGAARSFFVAVVALVFVAFTSAANAKHKHLESWYADALAVELSAKTEVRMRNGTRCDVLSSTHSVEVEFAEKWCESIGQALNYASQTGRRGAVALILESDSDERFLVRLRTVISWHQLPIAVIVLRPFGDGSLTLEFPAGVPGGAAHRTQGSHGRYDTKKEADRISLRLAIDLSAPVSAMDFLNKPRAAQRAAFADKP